MKECCEKVVDNLFNQIRIKMKAHLKAGTGEAMTVEDLDEFEKVYEYL